MKACARGTNSSGDWGVTNCCAPPEPCARGGCSPVTLVMSVGERGAPSALPNMTRKVTAAIPRMTINHTTNETLLPSFISNLLNFQGIPRKTGFYKLFLHDSMFLYLCQSSA